MTGHALVTGAVEDDVRVDLVAEHEQIVLPDDRAQRLDVLRGDD